MSKISFSRNHNGDPLVLVDGNVVTLAKECEGWDYLVAWVLAFRQTPSLQSVIIATHELEKKNEQD